MFSTGFFHMEWWSLIILWDYKIHVLKICSAYKYIFSGVSSACWVYWLSSVVDPGWRASLCTWISPLDTGVGYHAAAYILVVWGECRGGAEYFTRQDTPSYPKIASATQDSTLSLPPKSPLCGPVSEVNTSYYSCQLQGVAKGAASAKYDSPKGIILRNCLHFKIQSVAFLSPQMYDDKTDHVCFPRFLKPNKMLK